MKRFLQDRFLPSMRLTIPSSTEVSVPPCPVGLMLTDRIYLFTASLPLSLVESSSHVILAITGAGGHLGWFDGPYFKRGDQYPQQRWVLKPISEFLKAAVTALTEQADARKVVKGDDGWTWVVGSEGDLYGRVGWKEKAGHEVVHGAEDGTLQGL